MTVSGAHVLACASIGILMLIVPIPYGQKIKTVGKAIVVISRRGLAACRPLRFLGRSMEPFADRRANGERRME